MLNSISKTPKTAMQEPKIALTETVSPLIFPKISPKRGLEDSMVCDNSGLVYLSDNYYKLKVMVVPNNIAENKYKFGFN